MAGMHMQKRKSLSKASEFNYYTDSQQKNLNKKEVVA